MKPKEVEHFLIDNGFNFKRLDHPTEGNVGSWNHPSAPYAFITDRLVQTEPLRAVELAKRYVPNHD
jgi:hypothetical protein